MINICVRLACRDFANCYTIIVTRMSVVKCCDMKKLTCMLTENATRAASPPPWFCLGCEGKSQRV